MNKFVKSIIFIWFSSILYAQDARFYQYEMNDLFLNPALTGDRLFDNRGLQINVNYRSNSSKNLVNGDASALGLGMDIPLGHRFSVGQYFGNNRAVDGSFNNFNYFASASYKIINSQMFNDNHMLAIGMQLGVVNNSLNTKRLYYESQYSPFSSTGFDQNLESGESYAQQSFYKLDNNLGIVYRYKIPSKRLALTSGLSFYHISRYNKNTTLGDLNELRTNIHFQFHYDFNEKMGVSPHLLYTKQGITQDINLGSFFQYNIHQDVFPIVGLNLIANKATVYQLGLRYKNSMFKMSYAFANSRNTSFVNNGLEFAYIHTFISKEQTYHVGDFEDKFNSSNKEEKEMIQIKSSKAGDNYYLLKLKLIVDRLDVLINSKEISKLDIQTELNKIIVEIQELSKMTTTERYLELANQYKLLITEKLKVLETKIHQ